MIFFFSTIKQNRRNSVVLEGNNINFSKDQLNERKRVFSYSLLHYTDT